ncbi:hypothetical protein [Gracilimonas mengyeensis]|uniref:Ribbon-helix-helix protein, copG family n=1 Tax=Gracilimonas mengyeensis TaxID=1302730 RepID=A0A521DW31_9BACT|nr:hypothetical protein [Gracilimonas mengyeensis]SMO75907.1 hypothetical protein SAMN06265219_109164 [Gracilimonas mengyeensis]
MGKKDKNKKDIVWFGMKLTPEEKAKIKLLAERKGVSQKEAIMNLVNEEVVEYKIEPTPGSLLDRAKHLVGSVEGPGDLSTNPKYMEDFGKDSLS